MSNNISKCDSYNDLSDDSESKYSESNSIDRNAKNVDPNLNRTCTNLNKTLKYQSNRKTKKKDKK